MPILPSWRTVGVLCVAAVCFGMVACSMHQPAPEEPLAAASRSDLTTVYTEQERQNRDLTYRDARLLTMCHVDTQYEVEPYKSRAAWEQRAGDLRRQVLVAAGLWPLPEKTPLHAQVIGRVEHKEYTVEKVSFESYPGFLVAGNLYRPKGKEGKHPVILSPHGHWKRGRINDTERGSVPGRAISLARQGFVVFAWDMVGYGDTRQVNHSFASDSLSKLWGINLLGLQLWNSMRALDFVSSLPDVDKNRIGITGASGGATQTFLLTAVDKEQRIKVTAPVNMISTVMQGGSLCENAPGLRIDVSNVEIAALAAPRPQMMVSNTQDWTLRTPRVEYPLMRSFYRLYNAEEKLGHAHFDFPHNYNKASREAVYPWFAKWLMQAENPQEYREDSFTVDKDEDLLVFLKEAVTDRSLTYEDLPVDSYYRLPEQMNEQKLKTYLQQQAQEQLADAWPSNQKTLRRFHRLYGTALEHITAAEWPAQVTVEPRGKVGVNEYAVQPKLLRRSGKRDWIPAVGYQPPQRTSTATLVVHPEGKAALAAAEGAQPGALISQLLAKGHQVLAIDAFRTGEHILPAETVTKRDTSYKFFTTYNRTATQQRVQDILTAAAHLRAQPGVQRVNVVGLGEAGVWAMLASSMSNGRIYHTVAPELPAQTGRIEGALTWYMPGYLKLGGLETVAALTAPERLTVGFAEGRFDGQKVNSVYEVAGAKNALQAVAGQTYTTDQIVSALD